MRKKDRAAAAAATAGKLSGGGGSIKSWGRKKTRMPSTDLDSPADSPEPPTTPSGPDYTPSIPRWRQPTSIPGDAPTQPSRRQSEVGSAEVGPDGFEPRARLSSGNIATTELAMFVASQEGWEPDDPVF